MYDLISNNQRKSASTRLDHPPSAPATKSLIGNSLPKLRTNPRVGPPGGSTSARNSLLLHFSEVTATISNNNEEDSMPLSPAATSHLVEILQYCKTIIDFNNPQTMNSRCKKADYLTRLFNSVNNVHVFRNLTDDIRAEIFEMIKINLIREIPPIPLTIIYADSRVPLNTNSWLHLSLIHRILFSFVSNSEVSQLQNLLTKEFLTNFVALLESPDPKETAAVETFVLLVFDSVSGYRQILFQIIVRQILKYQENFALYPCVAPCLQFLLHFLKAQPLPLKPTFFQMYKTIIFPLMSSQLSSEFFSPFNQLAEFFVQQDPTISTWTLQEMVKHWPKTDTNKECSFISHFTYIAPYIPPNDILESGKIIFSILKQSLESLNFKTNVAALNVISNRNFIIVFSAFASQLIPLIMNGVNKCSQHWNVAVQKSAIDAVRVLVSVLSDIRKGIDLSLLEKEAQEKETVLISGWNFVLDEASKNDSTLDVETIKENISKLIV